MNFRELQNGVQVYELKEPVELIVKTKSTYEMETG